MKEKREKFSNRLGFILSCVGAAVGLGNIWMFSWKLGTFGGGAFLIPYFIFMAFFAYIGLISEISFGRMIKKGVMGVSELMKEKNIPLANYLPLISIVSVSGIFIFYIIVFGWIIKYFYSYLTIDMNSIDYATYFETFVGTSSSVGWHILAGVISIGVISLGVVKGIEKLNKIIMPLMFIIFIGLMIKSLTLPGATEGIKYLLTPKWEALANPQTWVMALGQSFFTVGLSGSALLVYGSYIDEKVDIPNSVFHTCVLDTCAALLAGFVIIPAAFAFGHNPGAGPGLLFITVPAIFSQISGGKILAGIFFLSVIFAAVSSAINQLEVPVEAFMYKFNVSRKKASAIVGTILILVGIPLDFSMNFFGKFADFMSVILIPLGALIILTFFYFAIDNKKIIDEIDKGASKKRGKYIIGFGKYLFVPGTAAVLILGLIFGSIG